MKQPHKKGFVVFTILAIVMLLAFAAFFVLFPMLVLKVDILEFLKTVYFNKALYAQALEFFRNTGAYAKDIKLLISMIVAVVVGLLFFVMIFVAIFGIKKKVGLKLLGALLALLGVAVAYFGVTVIVHNVYYVDAIRDVVHTKLGVYYDGLIDYIMAQNILGFVFTLGMVLTTVLCLVFVFIAIIKGIKYSRAALVQDEEVVAEELPEPEEEPQPEPEPEAVPEELPVFIPEPEDDQVDPRGLSTTALAAIIKDIVREIVRDELERNNLAGRPGEALGNDSHTDNHSVVGATFGGPLIVQYFNGGIQSAVPAPAPKEEPAKEEPAPAPQPEPQPEPAPVVEEPAPQPEPEPEPVVEEPAPVVEEVAPAPVPVVEKQPKTPIVRIPFEERLLDSDKELQDLYSELKNEILSWGVKSRVSSAGDTFRLHRKTYIKLTVAGKSLKLYFALNPDDYRDSTIPVQDASEKGIYAEIPLVFKVKSALSVRRCKQLIQDVMEKDGLEQGEIGTVNWIKELKAEMKARKAEKK